MWISTKTARIIHDPDTSRVIGELICAQTEAYNAAVAILNRGITIPKRSSKKSPKGFNKLLTKWRHEKPYRKNVPYSIHQAGWEQAWEANERMRDQAEQRNLRAEKREEDDNPPLKRDAKQHRRTLAYRTRKRNPALTISEGRKLTAKGHTVTFKHRHYGFTIKTTAQHLNLLDIRSMHIVPQEHYAPNVPLEKRHYIMKAQIALPGGLPDDLPNITSPEQILGFDRGNKKIAAASNRMEVMYDPAPDEAARKEEWKKTRAKKRAANDGSRPSKKPAVTLTGEENAERRPSDTKSRRSSRPPSPSPSAPRISSCLTCSLQPQVRRNNRVSTSAPKEA